MAVIGYHAADRYCMLGDYTPPVPENECVTVLQGMKQEAPEGVEVSYAMGSGFSEADADEKAKALALAKESDVIVAVVAPLHALAGQYLMQMEQHRREPAAARWIAAKEWIPQRFIFLRHRRSW